MKQKTIGLWTQTISPNFHFLFIWVRLTFAYSAGNVETCALHHPHQTHSRWMTFPHLTRTYVVYRKWYIFIVTFHVGWARTHPACERFIYFPAKACKTLPTKKTTQSHSKTATWMSATRVRRPTSSLLWTSVWWMKSQDLMYSLSMPLYGNVQRMREREFSIRATSNRTRTLGFCLNLLLF